MAEKRNLDDILEQVQETFSTEVTLNDIEEVLKHENENHWVNVYIGAQSDASGGMIASKGWINFVNHSDHTQKYKGVPINKWGAEPARKKPKERAYIPTNKEIKEYIESLKTNKNRVYTHPYAYQHAILTLEGDDNILVDSTNNTLVFCMYSNNELVSYQYRYQFDGEYFLANKGSNKHVYMYYPPPQESEKVFLCESAFDAKHLSQVLNAHGYVTYGYNNLIDCGYVLSHIQKEHAGLPVYMFVDNDLDHERNKKYVELGKQHNITVFMPKPIIDPITVTPKKTDISDMVIAWGTQALTNKDNFYLLYNPGTRRSDLDIITTELNKYGIEPKKEPVSVPVPVPVPVPKEKPHELVSTPNLTIHKKDTIDDIKKQISNTRFMIDDSTTHLLLAFCKKYDLKQIMLSHEVEYIANRIQAHTLQGDLMVVTKNIRTEKGTRYTVYVYTQYEKWVSFDVPGNTLENKVELTKLFYGNEARIKCYVTKKNMYQVYTDLIQDTAPKQIIPITTVGYSTYQNTLIMQNPQGKILSTSDSNDIMPGIPNNEQGIKKDPATIPNFLRSKKVKWGSVPTLFTLLGLFAPLLEKLFPYVLVHLIMGSTSVGKSTILEWVGAIWGCYGDMFTLNATEKAIIYRMKQQGSFLSLFDETQTGEAMVRKIVYQVASQQSRQVMDRTGTKPYGGDPIRSHLVITSEHPLSSIIGNQWDGALGDERRSQEIEMQDEHELFRSLDTNENVDTSTKQDIFSFLYEQKLSHARYGIGEQVFTELDLLSQQGVDTFIQQTQDQTNRIERQGKGDGITDTIDLFYRTLLAITDTAFVANEKVMESIMGMGYTEVIDSIEHVRSRVLAMKQSPQETRQQHWDNIIPQFFSSHLKDFAFIETREYKHEYKFMGNLHIGELVEKSEDDRWVSTTREKFTHYALNAVGFQELCVTCKVPSRRQDAPTAVRKEFNAYLQKSGYSVMYEYATIPQGNKQIKYHFFKR